MARMVAVDWDQLEARYVVASGRGPHLNIETAASIPLPREEGVDPATALAETLKSALVPLKLGRIPTLVAIDRSQLELVNLTLPPAAAAELPGMVRNEAMRETSSITDDTALDFITLDEATDQPRRVVALGLSRERLDQLQQLSTTIGITPTVVSPRPYAAASLVLRGSDAQAEDAPPQIVVNVFAAEVDLAIVADGRVILSRTLRQTDASTDPAAATRLLAEIKRTLVVAPGQLNGRAVASGTLLGRSQEHPALVELLTTELNGNLTLLDPFAAVAQGGPEPDNAGRFAAVLGLLADQSRDAAPAIDFLNPRKPPAAPNRRRTMVLAGAAGALVLLLGGYQVWSTFAEIDAVNEALSAELDQLDERFKRAGKQQKLIQAIRDWADDDVNWLDELRDLSLRFPSSRDAVLQRMGMSHARGSGAAIDMVGVVRDPAIVTRLENSIRDKHHQISSRHVQERLDDESYTWHFESSLVVAPRDKKQYVSHLPPEEESPAETRSAEQGGPPLTPPRSASSTR